MTSKLFMRTAVPLPHCPWLAWFWWRKGRGYSYIPLSTRLEFRLSSFGKLGGTEYLEHPSFVVSCYEWVMVTGLLYGVCVTCVFGLGFGTAPRARAFVFY